MKAVGAKAEAEATRREKQANFMVTSNQWSRFECYGEKDTGLLLVSPSPPFKNVSAHASTCVFV
jgi:hypothetical protein